MNTDSTATTVASLMQQSGVAFGTSGARGRVVNMTDRVCFGYTAGFLDYLKQIGEFRAGGKVALAGDLRSSTPRILAACVAGIVAAGGEPVFCGYVPTPAMALYAFAQGSPSLMVTGSHIPDDRNGIKFYRPAGEVLKSDEAGMSAQAVTFDAAMFGVDGNLLNPPKLPPVVDVAEAYVARYRAFFGPAALRGKRIGVYQHSAVGRDILPDIVTALGGEVLLLGRSEKFIPVDTEAVRPEDAVLARGWVQEHALDAIISTDGDSDRPLLADENGEWLRGDVLGVLCARALGLATVVTPVSSNTCLELSGAFARTLRTRIGSPYVIAAMDEARAGGAEGVCGYEANGGFLLGDAIDREGRGLTALPTRDAVLPMLAVLADAGSGPLSALLASLPARVTHSDRLENFPVDQSKALMARLTEGATADQLRRAGDLFGSLAGEPTAIDLTDGLRITLANSAIIHLRPSGNAPELRCYTEADSAEAAARLNQAALAVLRAQ